MRGLRGGHLPSQHGCDELFELRRRHLPGDHELAQLRRLRGGHLPVQYRPSQLPSLRGRHLFGPHGPLVKLCQLPGWHLPVGPGRDELHHLRVRPLLDGGGLDDLGDVCELHPGHLLGCERERLHQLPRRYLRAHRKRGGGAVHQLLGRHVLLLWRERVHKVHGRDRPGLGGRRDLHSVHPWQIFIF